MKDITKLYEFIDVALKNRKYSVNTAQGIRTALKLFEEVLTDDEKASIDKFSENLNNIFLDVTEKNKTRFSAGSYATYKARVQKVLNEYSAYGTDTTKLNAWNPRRRTTISKSTKSPQKKASPETSNSENEDTTPVPVSNNSHRINLSLRENAEFSLVVPRDITIEECAVIKSILDSLVKK
jgi:site-specific recombinase XerD